MLLYAYEQQLWKSRQWFQRKNSWLCKSAETSKAKLTFSLQCYSIHALFLPHVFNDSHLSYGSLTFFASANLGREITSEGVAGDDSGSDVTSVSGESQEMETTKEVVQGADVTTPRDILIDPEIEKRFGTEFWDCSIEEPLLAEWESVEVPDYLHVPAPNKFIATNFELLQEVAEEDALSPDLPPSTVPGFPVLGGRLSLTPCLLTAEGLGKGLPKKMDPCGKYKQEI